MNKRTVDLVYVSLYISLATACNYANTIVPIFQMPNGGSLELSVIVIFVAGLHLGLRGGLSVGIMSWVVGFLFGLSSYIVSFPQMCFDYILPCLALGLIAIFPHIKLGKLQISKIYVGIFACMVLKYGFQVISGAMFWPSNGAALSLPAWTFSIVYNFGFNFLTLIVALIVTPRIVEIVKGKVKMKGL